MEERYDGKTRKDDYKKYILIAAAVVLVIVIWIVVFKVFGTSNKDPDLSMVFVAYGVPSDDAQAQLEEFVEETVGDLNGDGHSIVDISYVDYSITNGDDQMMIRFSEDEYILFILSNQDAAYNPADRLEDYFVAVDGLDEVMTQINNTVLFEELGLSQFEFYAAIVERGDEYASQTQASVEVIQAILDTGMIETAED